MGTWGEGPFDNDDAADWDAEFEGADREQGLAVVRAALQEAADVPADGYVDTWTGCVAVAAAEVVAAARGLPVEESVYSESATAWVSTTRPPVDPGLTSLAVQALERVLAERSELPELWSEAGATTWRQSVTDRVASLRRPDSAA